MSDKITVYGASWCHDTRRTRRLLDQLTVPYDYIDIDDDPAAEAWITQANNGKRLTPTVDLGGGGGKLLFEPSDEEMLEALKSSAG
jgi:glutaredoxin